MKAKFIKSIVIAIILILGVGCVSLPFFFRPNEKAVAETLEPERVDWVLLDGNVPVALHYNNNGQKSFLTPGTTIPFSNGNSITFSINTINKSNIPSNNIFSLMNDNYELEKVNAPSYISSVTQLRVNGIYKEAGGTETNFSIAVTGNVNTDENANFSITKNGDNPQYTASNFIVDGNEQSTMGPGDYILNISYSYRLQDGTQYTDGQAQFTFSIIDDSIYTNNNAPKMSNVDTYTQNGTTEFVYNFNKFDNDATKFLYPEFTYNAKLYQYNIERNIADKVYLYQYLNTDLINNKINYAVYYGSQYLRNESFDIVQDAEDGSIMATLQFKELGEYTLTPTLIDSNGVPYNIPKVNEIIQNNTKTLVIFGYILNYTSSDGTKLELMDEEQKIWASTSATNNINTDLTNTTPTPEQKVITNQVPLVFSYLGTLNSETSNYKGGSISAPDDYNLTINYSYTSKKGFKYTGQQQFAFTIDNSNPDIYVAYKNDESNYVELNKQYINKDLYIAVHNSTSPFMAPVKVKVDQKDYDDNILSSYYLNPTTQTIDITIDEETSSKKTYTIYSTGNNVASLRGEYKFDVSYIYGPNQSVEKATYIIDKSNVTGIQFNKMGGTTIGNTITVSSSRVVLSNTPFTFTWKLTKSSGAKTWAKYTFAPITDNSITKASYTLADNKIGVTNGYAISSYDQTPRIIDDGNLVDSQYTSYSGLGVYFIAFEDEAGNSIEYAVINDTSLPYFLQESRVGQSDSGDIYENSYNPANPANIITDRTKITFGDYKLLEITNADVINKLTNYNVLKNSEETTFLASSVNNSYKLEQATEQDIIIINNNTAVIYKNQNDYNNSPIAGTYPIVSTPEQNIFFLYSTDANGNKTSRKIWMNLDKSQLQAIINVGTEEEATYVTITPDNGTNSNNLSLTFIPGGERESFEVEAIVMEYYSFVASGSTNYPFATTPTSTATLYKKGDTTGTNPGNSHENYPATTRTLTSTTGDDGKTTYTISNFYLSEDKIMSGMYIFKRIYTDSTPIDPDDPQEYTYRIFVDRNNIVDKEQNIGNFINVTVGFSTLNTDKEQVSFTAWDRKVDGEYAFITNKLPTKLFIPYSKYYDGTNSSQYYFSNLNVTIKYTADGQNPVEYYYTFNSAEQPYLDISNLSGAGVYEVTITDNTGYSIQGEDGNTQLNVKPNTFSFKYKIEHVAPQIEVYANNIALDRQNNNNYYTNVKNDKELYATWTDPIDPYYAKVKKVVVNNTQVIFIDQDSIIYELCNSSEDKTINYNNTGLIITFVNEYNYNGQTYYQFSYKYSFDISGTEDKTFTIELIYSGSSDKYTFNDVDYSKSTYTINLDRTRPDINIDNLYNNDAYLQSLINSTQYNDFKNLTEDNVNTSLPNIENYIFAVNENFVLKADYDAYPNFYVSNKLSNKNTPLAITPDHYLYGKYSDYNGRFDFESNIATMLGYTEIAYNGTSLLEQLKQAYTIPEGDTISGYYEIIERDYAGNYRNYVVYVIDPNEENDGKVELFKFGNSDISNIEDNYTVIREWNIPSFSSVLSWYTLKINNESFVFKNNDNNVDTINDINSFIATQFNKNITFHINLIGSTNSSTIVRAIYTHIPFTSQNFKIAKYDSTNDVEYEISMPSFDSNSSIVLTSLKIVNDKNQLIYEATYDNIVDIPSRITNNMLDSTYELTQGLYTFTVTDNYTDATGANAYSFVVAIDVNDLTYEEKYVYKSNQYFDTTSNTTYTNGSVTVRYLNSYKVKIKRNGVDYTMGSNPEDNGTTYNILLEAPRFDTSVLSNATGDKYVYEISYLMNGQQIGASDTIVIYNKISKINVNYLDNNLVSFDETNNTTSKAIKFSWENFKDTDVVNDFVATLEYLDDSGQTLMTDNYTMGTPINPQSSTNRYRFNLINTLLKYKRSVEFTISAETNLYSVEVNEQALNPSPVELDLNSKLNDSDTVISRIQSAETDNTLKNILSKCNSVTEQYYTNQKSFNIITNSDNNLKLKYYIFRNGVFEKATSTFEYNDEWNNAYITYIVLIYGQTNPIFEKLIGVTIVPTTTRFASDSNYLQYINKNGIQTTIDNQRITLRNDVVTNSQIDLVWNINYTQQTSWYNAGNIVYINYTYNNNTSTLITGQVYHDTMYRQTIKGAGNHTIEMYDWAGNKTRFGTGSSYLVDYCTITIIDQVVYTINNSAPIQYAIYNSGVILDIDSVFSNYYLPNSLTINVKKDGSTYTGYTIVDKAYLFEETGRYEVYINARYATTGTELTETAYNFSIINPNSSRLAWEFSGINGYEIVKVIKNNTDITADIKGNKASINTLYLSTSDQNYGKGIYTITIGAKSNDIMEMSYYTFTVRINDEVPVINSNPGYGETTKGVITIEYNPGQIYDQLGNATIRVLTYNEESGTFNLFGDIKINETNAEQNYTTNFILDQTNDYYIQLVTDSGNIALSFRVNRAEPLNAIAIIVIIASVITVVVLIIVFIKLRTKMKIR